VQNCQNCQKTVRTPGNPLGERVTDDGKLLPNSETGGWPEGHLSSVSVRNVRVLIGDSLRVGTTLANSETGIVTGDQ